MGICLKLLLLHMPRYSVAFVSVCLPKELSIIQELQDSFSLIESFIFALRLAKKNKTMRNCNFKLNQKFNFATMFVLREKYQKI